MKTLTEDIPRTSNNGTKEKEPVKQANKVERDSRGRLLTGGAANPNGRPPAGKTLVDRLRYNPKCQSILDKLIEVANTLGEEKPHSEAFSWQPNWLWTG